MDARHAGPSTAMPGRGLPLPTFPVPALVLVVEDEALVRAMGADIFADAGFRVIEAVNGEEAIEFLEHGCEVKLLFTDINLPGTIDGLALAWRVRDRWARIGIIIVSGRPMPHADELPIGCRFHGKPYDPEAVVRHARELTTA